ncbi:MAG: RNA polymerase-binding protein DksA [Rickettsiales bacterium]|jgi:DnaK suppressor protein|nr:RNA polymerase-binding protein DksA [Rickettsiales bacterium]
MVFNKKKKVETKDIADIQYNENGRIVIPAKYKPSDKEEFMNPIMKEYFLQKLLKMKDDISKELSQIVQNVLDDADGNMSGGGGDEVDRANDETLRQMELSTTENYRLTLQKIDNALKRIEDDSYGYCVITGDPIEVKRLDARPLSSKTLEAQEELDDAM